MGLGLGDGEEKGRAVKYRVRLHGSHLPAGPLCPAVDRGQNVYLLTGALLP